MVLTLVVLTDVFKQRIETADARQGHYEEREALGLGPAKRQLDLREEYFVLSSATSSAARADRLAAQRLSLAQDAQFKEWENKRVPRLEGQAEWGEVAEGYGDVPGSRWQPGMKRAPPPEPAIKL
jgi:cytochrome c oxidase assembly protein subunit 16